MVKLERKSRPMGKWALGFRVNILALISLHKKSYIGTFMLPIRIAKFILQRPIPYRPLAHLSDNRFIMPRRNASQVHLIRQNTAHKFLGKLG